MSNCSHCCQWLCELHNRIWSHCHAVYLGVRNVNMQPHQLGIHIVEGIGASHVKGADSSWQYIWVFKLVLSSSRRKFCNARCPGHSQLNCAICIFISLQLDWYVPVQACVRVIASFRVNRWLYNLDNWPCSVACHIEGKHSGLALFGCCYEHFIGAIDYCTVHEAEQAILCQGLARFLPSIYKQLDNCPGRKRA